MLPFADLHTGWKVAGLVAGLIGLGAAGMASSVNHTLHEHTAQTDSVLVELRAQRAILNKQLCIMVGVEPKLSCLQKN
jgi:hypothetical protein